MSKRHRRTPALRLASAAQHSGLIESLESRTLLAASPPYAMLHAGTLGNWGSTYTFKVVYTSNVRVKAATVDTNDITIVGPNGYSQKARFISLVDNVKIVTARYKVNAPGGNWDAGDNGAYKVVMNYRQVRDQLNRFVAPGELGTFQAQMPAYPSEVGRTPNTQLAAVNVLDFGATPNDGIDDTDEIQAAIDSLPRSNGVTEGFSPMGGTVWLPNGTYNLAGELSISSGVNLRGESAHTILKNTSTDANSAVVRLVYHFGHGYIMRAGVHDLSITSTAASGISVNSSVGDATDLRFTGLTISTGGPAIDLRKMDSYTGLFRNIVVKNPGSTALWVSVAKPTGNAALNRVENFTVTGKARPGYRAERGVVVLGGDYQIDGLRIDDIGAFVTPLSLTGVGSVGRVTLNAAAQWLPGGVLMDVQNAHMLLIDQLAGLQSTRRVSISGRSNVQVDALDVTGGASLAQAVAVGNSSHLRVDALRADGGLGNISPTHIGVKQMFSETPIKPVGDVNVYKAGPVSRIVVSADDYGATINDNTDDTAAIQAAINSLPTGNGIPNTGVNNNVGGIVTFGVGTYNISQLRVPSGVWLRGQSVGTLLVSSSAANSSAIHLVAGAASGINAGAGLADITVRTGQAAGVTADSALTTGLFDLRMQNFQVSAGGVGIDLRNVKTYHARLESIAIKNPGSIGIWMGDAAGYSADNRILSLSVVGTVRDGFVSGKGYIVLYGQTTLESSNVELANATTAFTNPLYVAGNAKIRGFWSEAPPASLPNAALIVMENATADVDRFLLVDDVHKIRLRNSKVTIDVVDITGRNAPLDHTLDMDATSRIDIGTVLAIRDPGMLDDPRVTIEGAYSTFASTYVDTALAKNTAVNIVSPVKNWQFVWGDTLGGVVGTVINDVDLSSRSVSVQIHSNPNMRPVNVIIDLDVPPHLVGKSAIASWRFDGPGTPIAWSKNFEHQYWARVTGSRTAVPVPTTLSGGNELIIQLPAVASGTFNITNVAVVPVL